MSKDLDNQLHSLHINPDVLKDATKLSSDDIQQIKDCFIADGWVHSDEYLGLRRTSDGFDYEDVMTGSEFYKKLMDEFMTVNRLYETPDETTDYVAHFSDFVEAAKRASGVKR